MTRAFRHLARREVGHSLLMLICAATQLPAQTLEQALATSGVPFTVTTIAPFNLPWRIALLPDGRMLVTEKIGALWLVTPEGKKTPVANIPRSVHTGRSTGYIDNNGMLGVYTSPNFEQDQFIYLTYSESVRPQVSGIALARARLVLSGDSARLENSRVIWRDIAQGVGGQPGGVITFSPDKKFIFLALGDRNRMIPAQQPDSPVGKILRLTLDGDPAPGNQNFGQMGRDSVPVIGWYNDTESAVNARAMYTFVHRGGNRTPAETWTSGHRNPSGLMFTPDGRLWEIEHGPAGNDELNLIEPGKNYGWPLVSNGNHYNGRSIPLPESRPEFAKPVTYWPFTLAPSSITYYDGALFPEWKGSALVTGLRSKSLSRVVFDGKGGARATDFWSLGQELRDVAVAADGSVWILVNDVEGGLLRITPKSAKR